MKPSSSIKTELCFNVASTRTSDNYERGSHIVPKISYMDLWHRTLGLRQQIQYINHTEIPVKTPLNHNKCAPVHNQPNTSLRPTHPVRTRSHERLHPQTSNGTGIPSQPPHGTPNPHNTHQETEMTLDIR